MRRVVGVDENNRKNTIEITSNRPRRNNNIIIISLWDVNNESDKHANWTFDRKI